MIPTVLPWCLLLASFSSIFGLPWWPDGKESACTAGDLGSIHEWGRSAGERNGNLFPCFCLENSMDRRACYTMRLHWSWHSVLSNDSIYYVTGFSQGTSDWGRQRLSFHKSLHLHCFLNPWACAVVFMSPCCCREITSDQVSNFWLLLFSVLRNLETILHRIM